MAEMFKMFGFYDDAGELVEMVPSTSIEEAKEYFEENNPDKDYLYIEVMF